MSITTKRDWRTSKAHLLLLSKFLRDTPFKTDDYWSAVLDESIENAINRFIKSGLLIN